MASLVVAFVVLSVLIDSGASTQVVVTGYVAEFQAGQWISVVNEQTEGFRIALRGTTVYERQEHPSAIIPAAVKPGVRVTVWYRSVAERRVVADKVRVLSNAATH